MKYLINGGCGFLGSNLGAEVLRRGHQLVVFDNLSRVGSDANLHWLKTIGEFEFIHGDTRNANDVLTAVQKVTPDVIFHLAGQVAMTTSIANPRLDFETNVLGGLNVLEAARAVVPGATIIFSSSNKVYGDLEWISYEETATRYRATGHDNGFAESLNLDFRSPYGCSKGAMDQYMLDYARVYGMNTVVFRHSSMYGGRQFATYDQGWIGWFCRQALLQKKNPGIEPFSISGTGKQVRDVLHAEDMNRLYFSAVDHIQRVRGHAFNIGGGMENSLSLLELFAWLESKVGQKLKYVNLPFRESDQRVFVADIAKATQLLGWIPQVTVDAGLTMMMEWVEGAL